MMPSKNISKVSIFCNSNILYFIVYCIVHLISLSGDQALDESFCCSGDIKVTGAGALDGVYGREDGRCGGGKSGHHFGYSQNSGNGELYYR